MKILKTILTILITAILVGSGVFIWQKKIAEQEKEIKISFKPKPGWEEYFKNSSTMLINKSITEIRKILGEPPVLVRSIAVNPENNKEIWIYYPYEYEPSGLYIYFKGNKVVKVRLDEFNGLVGSDIWQDYDFWF